MRKLNCVRFIRGYSGCVHARVHQRGLRNPQGEHANPAGKSGSSDPHLVVRRGQVHNRNILNVLAFSPEPDQAEYGGHNGSLTFTQVVNPRAINVAHVGIQYDNHVHSGPVPIANVSSQLGLPTYQTNQYWPQFYYNTYGSSPDGYWTGIDRDNPKDYLDQTIFCVGPVLLHQGEPSNDVRFRLQQLPRHDG